MSIFFFRFLNRILKSIIWIQALCWFFVFKDWVHYLPDYFSYSFRSWSFVWVSKDLSLFEVLCLCLILENFLQLLRKPFLFVFFEIQLNFLYLLLQLMIFFRNSENDLFPKKLVLVFFYLLLKLYIFEKIIYDPRIKFMMDKRRDIQIGFILFLFYFWEIGLLACYSIFCNIFVFKVRTAI